MKSSASSRSCMPPSRCGRQRSPSETRSENMALPTRSLTDIYDSVLLLHARGRAPELIGAFAVAAAQANKLGPVKLERKHDWIRLQFATGETISFDGTDWRH